MTKDGRARQSARRSLVARFVSFGTLGTYIQNDQLSQRAIVISTYALCGFANFSSIGIQIGGLSALAPGRRSDLARH